MKKQIFTITLVIILSLNLYSNDNLNKLKTSNHKVIKTHLKNFKNNVQVSTITEYDNFGKIVNYKHEYSCENIHDTYESKYHYNQKNIDLTSFENGKKIEEQKISVDDDENFLEIKTIYHKERNKYKTIKYFYKNKKLTSIRYFNTWDNTKFEIEDFYYDDNKIIKIVTTDNDHKYFAKLYEYNKHEKMIKETWISENKIVRVINYNYDSRLNLRTKTCDIFDEDKKTNGLYKYYYNNDGDITKETIHIKDELECETNYQYD